MKKLIIFLAFFCALLFVWFLSGCSTHSISKGVEGVVWEKILDGDREGIGYCVQQTADGGYIVVGRRDSNGAGDGGIWLIKTDADGNELWDKTLGGTKSDEGYCVQQTVDGGYIVTGEIRYEDTSDILLVKLSSSGDISWQLKFGGPSYDTGSYVIQTTDGSYVITGDTSEKISGFARLSCANIDITYYSRLFLIKIAHGD